MSLAVVFAFAKARMISIIVSGKIALSPGRSHGLREDRMVSGKIAKIYQKQPLAMRSHGVLVEWNRLDLQS
jgi:hypothetical protein